MVIKYTQIYVPLQGSPKYTHFGILVSNYTIWQPCTDTTIENDLSLHTLIFPHSDDDLRRSFRKTLFRTDLLLHLDFYLSIVAPFWHKDTIAGHPYIGQFCNRVFVPMGNINV
jgi:hypothetical protein